MKPLVILTYAELSLGSDLQTTLPERASGGLLAGASGGRSGRSSPVAVAVPTSAC